MFYLIAPLWRVARAAAIARPQARATIANALTVMVTTVSVSFARIPWKACNHANLILTRHAWQALQARLATDSRQPRALAHFLVITEIARSTQVVYVQPVRLHRCTACSRYALTDVDIRIDAARGQAAHTP